MKNRFALTGITMALAGLNACSDASTAPSSTVRINPRTPSFAFVDPGFTVQQVRVCKAASSPAGTYTIGVTGAATTSLTLAPGECKVALTNTAPGDQLLVTVSETNIPTGIQFDSLVANATIDPAGNTFVGVKYTNSQIAGANQFHGSTVVFYNSLVPVTICTYTKGWYRNNGENTITLTLDGRTPAQQRAIFDATPGKPGNVTWDGGNNVLNLYQQLLAALNNLNGNATGGPTAVDNAIASALAITAGSGTNIDLVGNPTESQIADLIDVLSRFNEGSFTGFPHCAD